jgi:hypothetical protein
MIRNYNVLTKLHTPLQVAVSILLLMFSSTSQFREALAAPEASRSRQIGVGPRQIIEIGRIIANSARQYIVFRFPCSFPR